VPPQSVRAPSHGSATPTCRVRVRRAQTTATCRDVLPHCESTSYLRPRQAERATWDRATGRSGRPTPRPDRADRPSESLEPPGQGGSRREATTIGPRHPSRRHCRPPPKRRAGSPGCQDGPTGIPAQKPGVPSTPTDIMIESQSFGVGLVHGPGPTHDAGWSSPVAREAHNLEVTGSNPVPATGVVRSNSQR
jgi:hypothetical protein